MLTLDILRIESLRDIHRDCELLIEQNLRWTLSENGPFNEHIRRVESFDSKLSIEYGSSVINIVIRVGARYEDISEDDQHGLLRSPR